MGSIRRLWLSDGSAPSGSALSSRRIIAVALFMSAVMLAGAVVVLVLAKPDRYRSQVAAYLQDKTGKPIEIGRLGISLFPTLSIRLYDFGVKNPKPFPSDYFLKVPEIDAEVDAGALLHSRLLIKSLVLNAPVINLISDPDGLWNFENAAIMKGSGHADREPPPFSVEPIPIVEVKDGSLFGSSLIDPSDRPGPVVLEARNITAQLKQVDFDSFTGTGSSLVADGEISADYVRFGSVPTTHARSHLRALTRQLIFTNLSLEAHGGHAAGNFSFGLAAPKTTFSTTLQMSDIDVAYLLAQFPGGRGKMTGKMNGTLKIAGEIEHSYSPLAGIHGSSRIVVRNGELPTLNQDRNMVKMTRFRDPGTASLAPSSFSSFSADMSLTNRRISSHQIDIAFHGIDLECSGSIGVAGGGELDYQGVAKVLHGENFFTNTMARMSGAKLENGRLSFPFRIAGTLDNPKFSVVN
jgi:hypothetical protein